MTEINKCIFADIEENQDGKFRRNTQMISRQITDHIITRISIIILIIVDVSLVIYIVVRNKENNEVFDRVSLFISCVFLVEVIMRVYGLGPSTFFHNCINAVDFAVVIATFIWSLVSCIAMFVSPTNFFPFVRLIMRLPRTLNILRIVSNKNNFLNSSRYITSENKRRYRLDGFDLDLCYITNRVIAMSFPSSGFAALYRNSIMDVAKFLNERHGKHYKIYNLCEERGYDTKPFLGQVERYLIKDHNVPQLQEMIKFAKGSRDWLTENEKNVIVVHCKGGKGRTGTMICVHLIDFEIFRTAQLSLDYFGERRTDLAQGDKFQGVETPSQSRYVGYFEKLKNAMNYDIPESLNLIIERILIHGIKGLGKGDGSDLWFSIHSSSNGARNLTLSEIHLKDEKKCKTAILTENEKTSFEIIIHDCPPLNNDIKIRFHSMNKNIPKGYDSCAFFFWFHTDFIKDGRLILDREQIDNPHKKSSWKVYKADFGIEVLFKRI